MPKSIVTTRAKNFNINLRERLRDYELIECDLIEYELQDFDFNILESFSDIIITSIFVASNIPRGKKNVWVVGEKSAKILSEKGYHVAHIAQNVNSLKKVISMKSDIIYLSGDKITSDIDDVRREIFYKVRYRNELSKEQIERLKRGVDYISLYSTNSANILLTLLIKNNLIPCLKDATIVTISKGAKKVMHNFNVCLFSNSNRMLEYFINHDIRRYE